MGARVRDRRANARFTALALAACLLAAVAAACDVDFPAGGAGSGTGQAAAENASGPAPGGEVATVAAPGAASSTSGSASASEPAASGQAGADGAGADATGHDVADGDAAVGGSGAGPSPDLSAPGFVAGPVIDMEAPTAPGGVTVVSTTPSTVSLSWSAAHDNAGSVSYTVRRDAAIVAVTAATGATVGGLAPATTYRFTVEARDPSGNSSAPVGVDATTATGPVATVPQPRAVPFTRMWTEVNNPADASAVNRLAGTALDARIADLTSWYVHFHSEASNAFPLGDASKATSATTLAEKLSARGAMVSAYRNGSYVTQSVAGQLNFGEAAILESEAPLAIGTWWPGHKSASSGSDSSGAARTVSGTDAAQTTISVVSAAGAKPAGAADTWPYFASRGAGAAAGAVTSQNTHDVVSWVRVDDEIMRVRGVSGDASRVTLTVDRGYFGTAAVAHGSGARVMSPVYIGSATATAYDTGYAGSPNVDRTDKALRYGVKIWQADGIAWLAGRIRSTFGAGRPAPYLQGYNTVWLDVSSCATYNNADALGQPVAPWSEPHGTIADAEKWKQNQLTKLAGLRAAFNPSTGYPAIRFTANNLASQGGTTAACRNEEMAPGNFDGGVLEHWLQKPEMWSAQMDQSFQIQTQDLPAIYWVKTAENSSGLSVDQYKRFAYGSFLLSRRDTAVKTQFGGMNAGLAQPDELFRWDLGPEIDRPATLSAVASQACAGTNVYRRDFTNGFVLVNPSATAATCTLGSPAYDVVNKTGGAPTLRTTVTVGARDAALLMH